MKIYPNRYKIYPLFSFYTRTGLKFSREELEGVRLESETECVRMSSCSGNHLHRIFVFSEDFI